jgi:uncharacterized protein
VTDPTDGVTSMRCPVCEDVSLTISSREGIEIDHCPRCRGVWLDRGELDKIIERAAPAVVGAARSSDAPLRDDRDRNEDRGRYDDRDRNEDRGRYDDRDRYEDRGRHDDRARYEDRGRHDDRDRNEDRGRYDDRKRRKKRGFLEDIFDFD